MMELPADVRDYIRQTPLSDPGALAPLYATLPVSVPELVRVVQGLFIHIFWAQRYGVTPSEAQESHVRARTVARTLAVLQEVDPAPLTVARPLADRFYGNCRDHSLLLTSFLRHQGTPARARCGFGTYFRSDHCEDHWVCEYWNGQRWVSVDAQLDALQRERLAIDFDPLHLPPGKFITAADAWRLCRAGRAKADWFGIFDMRGLWFIRGNLLRELAALNGAEMLPWDVWGLMDTKAGEESAAELALLDEVAAALLADDTVAIQRLYRTNPSLRVPPAMIGPGI